MKVTKFLFLPAVFALLMLVSTKAEMQVCTFEYAPVCGSDGVSYGNECMANAQSGVDIIHHGKCLPAAEMQNCSSFFDGCNTCMVSGGEIGGCTRMFCETYEAPQCLLTIEQPSSLNPSDQNFYDHIQDTLEANKLAFASKVGDMYEQKIATLTLEEQLWLTDVLLNIIEQQIFVITSSFPQDVALPDEVNEEYLFRKLLSLEIMKRGLIVE